MNHDHPHERRRRARIATAVVIAVLGTLMLAFFRVQVLGSDRWLLQSESNRLRPLPIPAPRGTIFDRDGRILADNVPGYEVTLLPAHRDTMRVMLERLRPYLAMSPERVESLMQTVRRFPRQPLLVDGDADLPAVAALEERRAQYPGVVIEMRPKRRYTTAAASAHVIGYVGEITAEELEREQYTEYEPRMIVGKEGIERQYEALLQGQQGTRLVEVDASGRIVGPFRGTREDLSEPGQDLHLNLDLELMEFIHGIFPDSMKGAVVALDVSDGGVLALYSAPSYDPNAFVGGIDPPLWNRLNTSPDRPLYNRAALGLYPPASTWKLASAAIGLELGVVTPTERMPIPCRGAMQYGNRVYRCWERAGHGSLDLAGALANSCDVYFYQLGLRIGLNRLIEEAGRLGFRERCHVDLPVESRGIYPEGPEFWERRWGYTPREGEVLSLAIGQGPNSQTPLKIAQFYTAIARGGSAPPPRIFRGGQIEDSYQLDLSEESLAALLEGLRRVMVEGGTGYMSSLEHWQLWGKSGTGQNETGRDHAWFAGFGGPWDGGPEVVVVALVEQGESGSRAAAPIMAKTVDFYLRRRHGIETDTIQTFREHLLTGTPAPWIRDPRRRGAARATAGSP